MLKKSHLVLLMFSVVMTLIVFSNVARSQDAPAAGGNAEAAPATFEELVAELSQLGPKNKAFFDAIMPFRNVTGKMHTLVTEHQTATPERKDQIQAEYEKLLPEAEKCRKNMVEAAVEAFNETPYENYIVADFCVNMVTYESARDNHEVAFKIAEALFADPSGLNEKAGDLYEAAANSAFSCTQFEKAEQWYAKAIALKSQLGREAMNNSSMISELKKLWPEEQQIREQEAKNDNLPRVLIRTNKGDITLELFEDSAPNTVANFIYLVKLGFYKDVPFHRVLPGFMAQGGDPTGSGGGGPGYAIDCECYPKEGQPAPRKHFRGSISMANAGRDTNGSQFFLMFQPVSHLNGRHTVFGRVIGGIEVLADIQRIDPDDEVIMVEPDRILEAKVLRDRGHTYEPVKNRNRR